MTYGGGTSGSASIGITSTFVIKEERRRRRITFVNDSVNTIYLSKGPVAVVNTGIRLNSNGGSYEDCPDPTGYLYRGIYSAIAGGAASNLTYIEEFI